MMALGLTTNPRHPWQLDAVVQLGCRPLYLCVQTDAPLIVTGCEVVGALGHADELLDVFPDAWTPGIPANVFAPDNLERLVRGRRDVHIRPGDTVRIKLLWRHPLVRVGAVLFVDTAVGGVVDPRVAAALGRG